MTLHSKFKLITAIDLLFLFLLCVSGSSGGNMGELIYYSAFFFPILIGLYFIYSPHERENVEKIKIKDIIISDIVPKKKDAILALPLLFPTVALILLFSFLTTLLLNACGFTNDTSFEEPFITAVFLHALIPAVLEELLFRFIPLKLLENEKKTAVLLSSLMFSFAHASLFQIPYAFIAGALFSLIYFSTGSILIPIAFHFLNNLLSLLSIYGMPQNYLIVFISVLSIISLVFIFIKRSDYTDKVKYIFTDEKIKVSYEPIIFIAFSLFLAIGTLVF